MEIWTFFVNQLQKYYSFGESARGKEKNYYDEKMLYGKHSSKPRNRNIADTMFKAGFIDTWGRGYKKIHDGFEKVGLPMPTVKSHCGGTLVTFQRGYDVVSGRKNVSSLPVVQLSERQNKICDLIRKNPFISGEQMSVVLSVVPRTIWRDLSDMQKKGALIREGNTSAGHWVVIGE